MRDPKLFFQEAVSKGLKLCSALLRYSIVALHYFFVLTHIAHVRYEHGSCHILHTLFLSRLGVQRAFIQPLGILFKTAPGGNEREAHSQSSSSTLW